MYAVNTRKACIKENLKTDFGQFEISMAFDDSCGATSPDAMRGDIRVWYRENTETVTTDMTFIISKRLFNGQTITASIENLTKVYRWCKRWSH